jgi:hypothetical protein
MINFEQLIKVMTVTAVLLAVTGVVVAVLGTLAGI